MLARRRTARHRAAAHRTESFVEHIVPLALAVADVHDAHRGHLGGASQRKKTRCESESRAAALPTHRHGVGDDHLRVDGVLLLPLLVAAEQHVLQACASQRNTGAPHVERISSVAPAKRGLRARRARALRRRTQRVEGHLAQHIERRARANQRASCRGGHGQRFGRAAQNAAQRRRGVRCVLAGPWRCSSVARCARRRRMQGAAARSCAGGAKA